MKTLVVYEEDTKELPMEYIYIASVVVKEEKGEKKFMLQSADASGVQPHSYLQ